MENLFQLQGEILMKGVEDVKAQLAEISKDVSTVAVNMEAGEEQTAGFTKSLKSIAGIGATLVVLKKVVSVGKELISTYSAASKQQTTLNAVLKATGNQVGMNLKQLQDYAGELQNITGISDEAIQGAEQILIATQALDKEGLLRATEDSADLSIALGTDMVSAARTLSIALQDPAEGLTRLRRSGIAFTDAEIDQIKAMQDAGDMASAQAAILDKLESKYKGIAKAVGDTPVGTLDKISQTWGDIKENLGQGILDTIAPALNLLLDTLNKIKDWSNKVVNDKGYDDALDIVFGRLAFTDYQRSDKEILSSLMGFSSSDLERALSEAVNVFENGGNGVHPWFLEQGSEETRRRILVLVDAIKAVKAAEQEAIEAGQPTAEESLLGRISALVGTDTEDPIANLENKINTGKEILLQISDMFDPDNIEPEAKANIDRLKASLEQWESELDALLHEGEYEPTDYLAEYNKQVGELSLQLLALDEQIEAARSQGNTGALGYLEQVKEKLTETFVTLVNGGEAVEDVLDDRKWHEKLRDIQNVLGSFASETTKLFSGITEAITQPWEQAVTRIEEDLKKLSDETKTEQDDIKRAYEAGAISYEDYIDRIQASQKKAKDKEDELKREKNEAARKAFEANKANSLAQAVINAAQSVTAIWAQYGAQPIVAAALTAISAAATGIEIGTIASQEYVPALAKGGITTGETIARIGDNPSHNEAVIPLPQGLQEFIGNVGEARETGKKLDRLIELTEKQIDVSEKGRVIQLDGKRVSKALAPDMDAALGEQYRKAKRGL